MPMAWRREPGASRTREGELDIYVVEAAPGKWLVYFRYPTEMVGRTKPIHIAASISDRDDAEQIAILALWLYRRSPEYQKEWKDRGLAVYHRSGRGGRAPGSGVCPGDDPQGAIR